MFSHQAIMTQNFSKLELCILRNLNRPLVLREDNISAAISPIGKFYFLFASHQLSSHQSREKDLLVGGGRGGGVCKRVNLVQLATLKTRGKLERIRFRKDFWYRY